MHLARGGAKAVGGTAAGLSEALPLAGSPFPITIGPEQAVAHRGWREARDRVLTAALAGPSLILVLGPAGTGKSLLLQELARVLRAGGADVLLQERGDLPAGASAAWAGDGRPSDGKASDGRLSGDRLAEGGARRVVLIDEADRLNEAMLERLGRLGECAIVLAGTADPGDDAGKPSAATVVRLAALAPDEVAAFLAARLAAVGLDAGLLSGGAVVRLAKRSGGIPRLLNMLAGAALFLARAEGAARVEAEHVDQAAALRDGDAAASAVAPAKPVVPGSAARQEATPEALPLNDAPGAPIAALPAKRAPRRRAMVVLGAGVGIAAACGWLTLGHGDRAGKPGPVMAEATAPLAARPAMPERERQVAAAVLPTPRAAPDAPVVPALQPPLAPASPPPASAALEPDAAAPAPVAEASVPPPSAPSPSASEPEAVSAAPVAAPPARGQVATAAPPETAVLPSGAPVHVLLRYGRGSAEAVHQAGSLVVTLRAAGFAVDGLATLRRDDKPGARYFFAEDRDAAASVLKAAGLPGRGTLAEAAKLDAPPRPGTVELVVPPSQVEAGGRREPFSPGRS